MTSLPIDTVLPRLLEALNAHNRVLLQAPPGAGKTTRVPLALRDALWLGEQRILVLEPRRLAARAVARFMAASLDQSLGQTVGLRTRLETRVSRHTRIEVVTEGVLTRMLLKDPALEGIGAVIFDEFHERSLHGDLGMALALESQQALREDLRLLIMSATLDAAPLAKALEPAPVITSEGRSFPVSVSYHPTARQTPLAMAVADRITTALNEQTGSLLVFLPGTGDIRRVQQHLSGRLPEDVLLCPLYGALPPAAQDKAIQKAPEGQRKVVLATAIAETSLTIEGVRLVIDAGWERRSRFDPRSGMSRLVTERVSQANAEQRRGRAGRLEPGHCYRLWSESEHQGLATHSPAEILTADLAPLALNLAEWGTRDPAELMFLDPPPPAHWQQARDLLQWLDAVGPDGAITAQGKAMNALGLAPRLAHMVLKGREQGLGHLAAELAALLSDRDPLGQQRDSDLGARIRFLRRSVPPRGALAGPWKRLRHLADTLRPHTPAPADTEAPDIGPLLAWAFPDRIAQRRPGSAPRYRLSNGRGAWLPADDSLAGEDWLVAADLDGDRRESRIYLAAPVTLAQIQEQFEDQVIRDTRADWDKDRGRVVTRDQTRLGALILEERPGQPATAEQTIEALLGEIRRQGLDSLPWTPASRQWCYRVRLLHRWWPEHWPDVTDEALLDRLETWLGPFLAGCTRWSDLARLSLQPALDSLLPYTDQQALNRLAPARVALPIGQSAALDYEPETGPVLAVKLQAVFGWEQVPLVADGHQPVTLHLLSPARRPLAITSDLASFWRQAYPQVRKEYRGRYPKHPWPEDPLTATATQSTKR